MSGQYRTLAMSLFNLDSSSAASLPRNKANEFGCMTRPHILATSLNCWLNGTSRRDLLQSTTEQLQLKQCTCTFLTSFVKKRCGMKAFDLIRNRAKCMICTCPTKSSSEKVKKSAFSFFASCTRAGGRRQQ